MRETLLLERSVEPAVNPGELSPEEVDARFSQVIDNFDVNTPDQTKEAFAHRSGDKLPVAPSDRDMMIWVPGPTGPKI